MLNLWFLLAVQYLKLFIFGNCNSKKELSKLVAVHLSERQRNKHILSIFLIISFNEILNLYRG
jgi:hypothetical protein